VVIELQYIYLHRISNKIISDVSIVQINTWPWRPGWTYKILDSNCKDSALTTPPHEMKILLGRERKGEYIRNYCSL